MISINLSGGPFNAGPIVNGGKGIFETGVIKAGVNGAGVKLGPAL